MVLLGILHYKTTWTFLLMVYERVGSDLEF